MVLTLSHTLRSDDSFDDFWRRGAVPSRRGGAGQAPLPPLRLGHHTRPPPWDAGI